MCVCVCVPQVFCGEFPQCVSREALGDQAELGGVDLPSLRQKSSLSADGAEAGRATAGGPV